MFAPEKIDLNTLIKATIDLFTELTEIKQIKILTNVPESIVVFADKNMLMTVFRNLISNALKFSNHGKNIYIFIVKYEKEYIITIKDEGIGMKPEDRSKLFQLGTHFTTFGTDNENGTGLGLVLCQEFVEKHGGKIWVESVLGKGSEFKFTLPLCND